MLPLRPLPTQVDTSAASLSRVIEALTRSHLHAEVEPFAYPGPSLALASQLELWRLSGRAAVSRTSDRLADSIPAPALALPGASRSPFAFVLATDGHEVTVALGAVPEVARARAAVLATALGSGSTPVPWEFDPERARRSSFLCFSGLPEPSGEQDVGSAVDAVLDSVRGVPLLFLVLATPWPADRARVGVGRLDALIADIERIHLAIGPHRDSQRRALDAQELAWAERQRVALGLSGSLWQVSALVGSPHAEAARHAAALLASALRGPAISRRSMQPFRCGRGALGYSAHSNVLTTAEVATICLLPTRDRLGFSVRPVVRFAVDHPPASAEGIALGTVLDGAAPSGRTLAISPAILCRHTLVCGHTGSGKSTTTRTLLRALASRGVPFLVLEPAKSEYRELAREVGAVRLVRGGGLPREGEVPLLLNPLAPSPGFPIHTHLDFVKQAFVASFGLIPPAPYLLETAIHRAFENRGWDLVRGEHRHGHDALAIPTLRELFETVRAVVQEAGYDREIERNLTAALETRIGNLCNGPKGLALAGRDELPEEWLFEDRCVLELEDFGSDAERAFVMGIVLMRLFERRRVAGASRTASSLQHLLVIEEAHRLLRRTAERSLEEGNMAHQAVEAFTHLLAEVRAYGQGVLIVEQLPSKLAPDVVKQSGLKIVHRLPPKADRDEVGDCMALDEDQKRALANLEVGEAVVHGGPVDAAVRVRIADLPPARHHTLRGSRLAAATSESAVDRTGNDAVERAMRRARVEAWLNNRSVQVAADRFWLELATGVNPGGARGRALRAIDALAQRRRLGIPPGLGAGDIVDFAIEEALVPRALHFAWSGARMREILSEVCHGETDPPGGFGASLVRDLGPHSWCASCPCPCRFGFEGERIARSERLRAELRELATAPLSEWATIVDESVREQATATFGAPPIDPPELLRCVAGHALVGEGLRDGELLPLLEWLYPSCGEHGGEDSELDSIIDRP